MNPDTKQSLIDRLRDRKVIPYFITYVGGSFAFIQFVDWFTTRNFFSPLWTDFFLYVLILLIPAVLIVLYAAGNPAGFKFTKTQVGLTVANLLLAATVLLSKFTGTTFAATMQKVMVTDESGQVTRRNVPTADFTSRIAVFPFENSSNSPDTNLYSQMLPMLLCYDINQNNRLYGLDPIYFIDELKVYNYTPGKPITVSAARKIAEDNFTDFFCLGKFSAGDDSLRVHFQLYSTHDGKLLHEFSQTGNAPASIIDHISPELVGNIYTEDFKFNLEDYIDLPVAELISTNPTALRDFVRAIYVSQWDNDLPAGIQALANAIQADPNCAECFHFQAKLLAGHNDIQEGVQVAQKGLSIIDHLPERQQFRIKSDYFLLGNNTDQAINLLEMWRKLYPQNIEPYNQLIRIYGMMSNLEQAKLVGQEAINNHLPGNYLVKLAQLASAQQQFAEAEDYLKQYEKAFPDKAKESRALGELYLQQGKFAEAENFFESLSLVKINDVDVQIGLAKSKAGLGNFGEAESLLTKSLSFAATPSDSFATFVEIENYLAALGQMNQCLSTFDQRIDLCHKRFPPIYTLLLFLNSQNMQRYVDAGQEAKLEKEVATITATTDEPTIKCGFEINLGFVTKDTSRMGEHLRKCYQEVVSSSGEANAMLLKGYLEYIKDQPEKALSLFNTFLEATKNSPQSLGLYYIQAMMQAEQWEEARKTAYEFLATNPLEGRVWVMLGDINWQLNDKESAKQAYQKAEQLWQKADPDYLPAQLLKDKLRSITI